MAQASDNGVDLLIIPAGDWPAIATMHAKMARFRAIEQGVTVLRPASAGLTTIVGPTGEVVASVEQEGTTLAFLGASVPIRRIPTAYGVIGDFLTWVSGFVLAAWILIVGGAALRNKIRNNKSARDTLRRLG